MNNKKLIATLLSVGIGAHQLNTYFKNKHIDGAGKYALITGASSGLGEAFSKTFARHHFNLVLAARSEDKLNQLAHQLKAQYEINVIVIPADLSKTEDIYHLYDKLSEKGIEIEQLVNNAGYGKSGRLVDIGTEQLISNLKLNITSVTLLSRLFGKDMVERNSGKILNVASLGAMTPDPYFNVYGPSRAYVMKLTETMYGELLDTNVNVSVLCPGPLDTNWAANAGKSSSAFASNPQTVANHTFYKMQNNELVIIPTLLHKIERQFLNVVPNKMLAKIIGNWQLRLINK